VDPITILAACTAVWNGIKKASEFAQEAEGVWSQLSKYAGLADQLEQHITTAKNKPQKLKLFGKLDFSSDTQEAFNAFEAEHKLMEMEAEIKTRVHLRCLCRFEGGYGSLDGYRKFLEMRRKIRAERIRMKQEQQDMQKKFWDDMLLYGGSSTVVVVGCLLLYMAIDFIFRYAK
jgi:ATP-dependent Lon protease